MTITCPICDHEFEADPDLTIQTCPKCKSEMAIMDPAESGTLEEMAAESWEVAQDVVNMDDEALIDELNMVVQMGDFMKYTDDIIMLYMGTGRLSKRGRKMLEGAYVLAYTRLEFDGELQ